VFAASLTPFCAADVGDTAGWGVGSGVKGSTAKDKGSDSRASTFFRMLVGDADEEEATVSPKTPKSSATWFTRGASGGRLGGLLPLGGNPANSRTPRPADEDEDSDSEGYGYGGAIWEDATPTGSESDRATSPPSPEEAMRPPSREASACYEPLLVRMCKDAAKLRFVSGLAAFEHRVRSIVSAKHSLTHSHTHTQTYTYTYTYTHKHTYTYTYTHTKRNLRICASIKSSCAPILFSGF
jgi:hypothetical protein